MIKLIEHPTAKHNISILRDKTTEPVEFRLAMKRLGFSLAMAAYEDLNLKEISVRTPLALTDGHIIDSEVILIPVLRAGLGLLESFTAVLPEAKVGFFGVSRNESTFTAETYYENLPEINANSKVILLETMIATGGTSGECLQHLQLKGATDIILVAAIGAREGVEKILSEYPETTVILAALDQDLNDSKYIVPGLGDAGDRLMDT